MYKSYKKNETKALMGDQKRVSSVGELQEDFMKQVAVGIDH